MGLALDEPRDHDERWDIDGLPVIMRRTELERIGDVRIEAWGPPGRRFLSARPIYRSAYAGSCS